MNKSAADRLLALNADFYQRTAVAFANTRTQPQPGFYQLASEWMVYFPNGCNSLLDVGCGEGRLGRFLMARELIGDYVGIDSSSSLLAMAKAGGTGRYFLREISQPDAFAGIQPSAAIACLATLQHIPGRANRLAVVQRMANYLSPGGKMIFSHWQFAGNPRQRRKIRPWSLIGVSAGEIEPGDYLLTWGGSEEILRYVAQIDAAQMERLAGDAGLQIEHQFRSDGREGDLNLYLILSRRDSPKIEDAL